MREGKQKAYTKCDIIEGKRVYEGSFLCDGFALWERATAKDEQS